MTIGKQIRIAVIERIARYTVGIAVESNQFVGTGTLVAVGGDKFVLTAAHVIGDSQPHGIRFWIRPTAPIKEKAATDIEVSEIGRLTLGVEMPIIEILKDATSDIAAIKIEPSFVLPEAADTYDIRRSYEFLNWDEKKLDGLSLVLFGFPVGNFKELLVEGNRSYRFIGCAEHLGEYDVELNNSVWPKLPSKHSRSRDFVFKYHGLADNIEPHGFSGGAVWVLSDFPSQAIWYPEPILIGVVHHVAQKSGLLIAAKLPTFIQGHLASNSKH